MCHLICVALPVDAPRSAIVEVLSRVRRTLDQVADRYAVRVLGARTRLYQTSHRCDCGTTLGRPRARARASGAAERVVRSLEKKGWSAAKIARWQEQRGAAANRERPAGGPDEAEMWAGLLAAMLDAGAPRVGLVVRWSDDELRLGPRHDRAELVPELLLELEENVVVEFAA